VAPVHSFKKHGFYGVHRSFDHGTGFRSAYETKAWVSEVIDFRPRHSGSGALL